MQSHQIVLRTKGIVPDDFICSLNFNFILHSPLLTSEMGLSVIFCPKTGLCRVVCFVPTDCIMSFLTDFLERTPLLLFINLTS